MTDEPKKNAAARALGKRRAKVLGPERLSEIGKLGGRPRSDAPRCPCGKFTAKLAKMRGHKCEASA